MQRNIKHNISSVANVYVSGVHELGVGSPSARPKPRPEVTSPVIIIDSIDEQCADFHAGSALDSNASESRRCHSDIDAPP